MGRYLELARRALESSPGSFPNERNENNEKSATDPYQDLARAALAKIRRPDYPTEMIPWLCDSHAGLYDELTRGLPDEIHKLWAQKAPLAEFQQILDLWLVAHRTAYEMYQSAHRREGATRP